MKRILLDIETAPILATVWKIWEANVAWDQIQDHWYMLTWSALDLDTGEATADSLHLHKTAFSRDVTDDSRILKGLWKLLDDADVVIAHNGDRFDIPKINARFIAQGFPPPSPYLTVDTLKIARQKFSFTSNRLDHLGDILGVGRKIPTDWKLWQGCMEGDVACFEKMLKYNQQDVLLLRDVYKKLLPWMGTRNMVGRLLDSEGLVCSACGSESVQRRGYSYTKTQKYQRYVCIDCHAWSRARIPEDKGKAKLVGC